MGGWPTLSFGCPILTSLGREAGIVSAVNDTDIFERNWGIRRSVVNFVSVKAQAFRKDQQGPDRSNDGLPSKALAANEFQ